VALTLQKSTAAAAAANRRRLCGWTAKRSIQRHWGARVRAHSAGSTATADAVAAEAVEAAEAAPLTAARRQPNVDAGYVLPEPAAASREGQGGDGGRTAAQRRWRRRRRGGSGSARRQPNVDAGYVLPDSSSVHPVTPDRPHSSHCSMVRIQFFKK